MRIIIALLMLTAIGSLSYAISLHAPTPASPGYNRLVTDVVSARGRFEGASEEYHLRFAVHDRYWDVRVRPGDYVRQGDLLVTLDSRTRECEVIEASQQYDLAVAQWQRVKNGPLPLEIDEVTHLLHAREAELRRAQFSWERAQDLIRRNAVSRQYVENAERDVLAAESNLSSIRAKLDFLKSQPREDEVVISHARVQVAAAQLEHAKKRLLEMQIRAPVDGVVLEVNARAGEVSGSLSESAAVVMVADGAPRVRAFVDELDAVRVVPGMPVLVQIDGLPGHDFYGQVASTSPRMTGKSIYSSSPTERIDTKTREVWVDVNIPREQVVIGLQADIEIDVSKSGTVMVTKEEAL